MKERRWLIALVVLLVVTLACGASGGGDSSEIESPGEAPEEKSEEAAPSGGSGSVDTDFPLPRKYSNLTTGGSAREEDINFQTPMSIDEVMAFYREEFGDKLGYTERDYLTSQTEATFQLVFDGHPRGSAIVIQGVDLGNGTTNVNIGFEDV